MTARSFLGAGDLYIARITNGVPGSFEGPFEANKFEIKPNSDLKESISKGRSTYGQVTESVSLAKPSDFSLELTEVNTSALALALMGTSSVVTQTSGAVVDEVVTAVLDKWIQLAKNNVSSVVVKNSAGTTTYVLGTDYTVDAVLGWVKPLSTGTIAAGPLKISYSAAATAATQIAGGTLAEIRAMFKFNGVNLADQSSCIVDVYEAVLAADSAMDFLSSDFAKVGLKGRLKTPTGKVAPFVVLKY